MVHERASNRSTLLRIMHRCSLHCSAAGFGALARRRPLLRNGFLKRIALRPWDSPPHLEGHLRRRPSSAPWSKRLVRLFPRALNQRVRPHTGMARKLPQVLALHLVPPQAPLHRAVVRGRVRRRRQSLHTVRLQQRTRHLRVKPPGRCHASSQAARRASRRARSRSRSQPPRAPPCTAPHQPTHAAAREAIVR